jgi:hypothetical protein
MEFTFQFLHILLKDLLHAAPVLISLLVLISVIGYIIGKAEGWSLSPLAMAIFARRKNSQNCWQLFLPLWVWFSLAWWWQ